MFGNGWLFEVEGVDDLADAAFFEGEEGEDIATAWFCDSVESVGGGGSTRHGTNIYPYRNMSRGIFWRELLGR
jgi:hypothetical protein